MFTQCLDVLRSAGPMQSGKFSRYLAYAPVSQPFNECAKEIQIGRGYEQRYSWQNFEMIPPQVDVYSTDLLDPHRARRRLNPNHPTIRYPHRRMRELEESFQAGFFFQVTPNAVRKSKQIRDGSLRFMLKPIDKRQPMMPTI